MATATRDAAILITGATGFVGRRLADRALAGGYRVRALVRREWDGPPAVALTGRFLGELPYSIPREALSGVRFVIHCAAYAGQSEKAAAAVNVAGTLRLAGMAREAGADAFVFVSTSSARPDALSAYGRSKWEAERRLLETTGMNVVVVRPNLVTGPGYGGVFGRMRRTVERLPVIPLLGGGKSWVQPIHVDDLCTALLRCAERAADLNGAVLNLGLPEGMTLAELLGRLSLASTGRRKPAFPIPIWPVEIAVGIAEKIGVPTPFGRANLKGLRRIEKADTAGDLARLGIALKDPLAPGDAVPAAPDPPPSDRPARILLVGAGRIGLVHAVTVSRMKGMVLSGMVDKKAGAIALIRKLGLAVPGWKSLEDGIAAGRPDAAIIATPTSSHLPLAAACAGANLAVLVEKPAALGPAQIAEFEELSRRHPGRLLGGWVLTRNPHVTGCLARLKAGEFGAVEGFTAFSLMSFVMGRGFRRWETSRATAGGGAYLTAGGHALSMVHAAFGKPSGVSAQSVRLHSGEVEDSFVAEYEYPGFRGTHYCSWSIDGFPRLESVLVVETSRGRLTLTPACGFFEGRDGTDSVVHQRDFDRGFNMAPDYAGAGFAVEYADLARAASGEKPDGADIGEALAMEKVLARAYAAARETGAFIPPVAASVSAPDWESGRAEARRGPESRNAGIRRILDLRGLTAGVVRAFLAEGGDRSWDGIQVLPGQGFAGAPDQERLRVTVPDFGGQTRLIFSGRFGELVRRMGTAGTAAALLEAFRSIPRERGATFWAAAAMLTRAGMARIPRGFSGAVLVHAQLADLALAVGRPDRLSALLAMCRSRCPRARIGFHSGMASEAVNAAPFLESPVDEISVITSPEWRYGDDLFRLAPGIGITAETGEVPAAIARLATARPVLWAHGAAAVMVGGAADAGIALGLAESRAREWAGAFPGIPVPGIPYWA